MHTEKTWYCMIEAQSVTQALQLPIQSAREQGAPLLERTPYPEAQSGAARKGCKGRKRKGEVGMRGLHSPGGVMFKMQPSAGHGGRALGGLLRSARGRTGPSPAQSMASYLERRTSSPPVRSGSGRLGLTSSTLTEAWLRSRCRATRGIKRGSWEMGRSRRASHEYESCARGGTS